MRTFQKLTQRQQVLRDALVEEHGGKWKSVYIGGIRHFDGLTVQGLAELIERGLASATEAQNDGPTHDEFIDLAMRVDQEQEGKPAEVRLGGYVVARARRDCRVSVDRVTVTGDLTLRTQTLFFKLLAKHSTRHMKDEPPSLFSAWWD